jgi:hypothetical protein
MTQIERKREELRQIRAMDKAQGKTRYFYKFTYQEIKVNGEVKPGILTAYFDQAFKKKPDIAEASEIIEASFYGMRKVLSVSERK